MKIEPGKSYRTRSGKYRFGAKPLGMQDTDYKWSLADEEGNRFQYTDDGYFLKYRWDTGNDIVEELD